MMLVASLMVHPGGRVTVAAPLGFVGAARTAVVSGAGEEFGGRIFREIVKQSLPTDAATEASGHDAVAMTGNGDKMLDRMYHISQVILA